MGRPAPPPYRWNDLPAGQRGAILAGWIALGLIETARVVFRPASMGVTYIPWDYALVANFPWWFAWALLTPAVFSLADRFRLDGGRLPVRLMQHGIAGAVVVAVHLPAALTLWYYTNPLPAVRATPFLAHLVGSSGGYLLLEILAYGATLGLFYAIDNHRRLHFAELEAARFAARAAESEAAATRARLDALRMELHPHFLFNTLNGISGLIRTRANEAALGMLGRLANLLRISLQSAHQPEVPLSRELANLELYLDIERQRFSDRLRVECDVEPQALACAVPILCLQPLAENAIRHGLSRRPGPVRLTVTGRLERPGGNLHICITDDGPGFAAPESVEEGVGFRNTRARLVQLYGQAAALEIANRPGGGAMVSLRLPGTMIGEGK
ncbi:MAG: sensor histidine kinase [Gemmatimonadales bacterium]